MREYELQRLSFAKTSSHLVDNGRRSRDRRGNARRLQTTARERAAWAHPDPLQKEEELGVGRQSSRTEGRAYEPIGLDQAARRTWRWCRPPTSGICRILPVSGSL